jgi:hypothetical protein
MANPPVRNTGGSHLTTNMSGIYSRRFARVLMRLRWSAVATVARSFMASTPAAGARATTLSPNDAIKTRIIKDVLTRLGASVFSTGQCCACSVLPGFSE